MYLPGTGHNENPGCTKALLFMFFAMLVIFLLIFVLFGG